jgi:hypothetical protein
MLRAWHSLLPQVELTLPAPLPFLPPAKLRLALKHQLSVDGQAVRIDLVETTVRLAGLKGSKGSLPAPRALLDALRDALATTPAGSGAGAGGSVAGGPAAAALRGWVSALPSPVRAALAEGLAGADGALAAGGALAGSPLGAPLKAAQAFQTRASTFAVTALADAPPPAGGTVRVARSALGELRVFLKA